LRTDPANPEELIAAAHAGCFSMALAFFLASNGMLAKNIETTAELSLEGDQSGWKVTGIQLRVLASVPGASNAALQKIAEQAKSECLVSRLLSTTITLSAKLVQGRGDDA
jgi:lipoyl-dependent peroxiredoxin